MCLDLRKDSSRPWKKGNIRWKACHIFDNGKMIVGLYRSTIYLKRWRKAKGKNLSAAHYGFHVFTSRKSARNLALDWGGSVVKVKVKGFLASGWHYGKPCETWEYMRLVGKPIRVMY